MPIKARVPEVNTAKLVNKYRENLKALSGYELAGSPFTFARSLAAVSIRNDTHFVVRSWDLDGKGRGQVLYDIRLNSCRYYLLIFSDQLKDSEREERAIGNRWDAVGFLAKEPFTLERIDFIERELSKGGRDWRVPRNTYCWAKMNRSARTFDHVVSRLALGIQPDLELVVEPGYLMRNSGVIANGAQGTLDYAEVLRTEQSEDLLSRPFYPQLLCLLAMRTFSVQLVNFLAKQQSPMSAIALSKSLERFIGVGNSSGQGLVLFLRRQAHLLGHWAGKEIELFDSLLKVRFDTERIRHSGNLTIASIHDDANRVAQCPYARNRHAAKNAIIELLEREYRPEEAGLDTWLDAAGFVEDRLWRLEGVYLLAFRDLLFSAYPEQVESFTAACAGVVVKHRIPDITSGAFVSLIEEEYGEVVADDASRSARKWFFKSAGSHEPRCTTDRDDLDECQIEDINFIEDLRTLYQELRSMCASERIYNYAIENSDRIPLLQHICCQLCRLGELVVDESNLDNTNEFVSTVMSRIGIEDLRQTSWKNCVGVLFRGVPLLDGSDE